MDETLSGQMIDFERKRPSGLVIAIITAIIAAIIILFILAIKFPILKDSFLWHFFSHIKYHTSTLSYLGMYYVTLFGGLFFVTVPIEPYFVVAIQRNNAFIITLAAFLGITISYTVDYILGYKFSNVSKKLISVKQFYKMKAIINKRGSLAIVFFNIIGFGSQQITFVLGVFRYNWIRLALLTFLGQAIKYSAILAVYLFFK